MLESGWQKVTLKRGGTSSHHRTKRPKRDQRGIYTSKSMTRERRDGCGGDRESRGEEAGLSAASICWPGLCDRARCTGISTGM